MNNLSNCPVCGAALAPEQLLEIKKHYWFHKLEIMSTAVTLLETAPKAEKGEEKS